MLARHEQRRRQGLELFHAEQSELRRYEIDRMLIRQCLRELFEELPARPRKQSRLTKCLVAAKRDGPEGRLHDLIDVIHES